MVLGIQTLLAELRSAALIYSSKCVCPSHAPARGEMGKVPRGSVLREGKSTTYHEEGVADPQAPPPGGAVGYRDVLAVDSNGHGWRLTHRAAADVGLDFFLSHGHHGQRGRGGEPVGLVVAAGVVADVPGVTVQKRHSAEARQAGARQPCTRST